MSAVVAAPYLVRILRHHYPLQSAGAWFAYSGEMAAIAAGLAAQISTQEDLKESVARMSGEFIESAQKVVGHRTETLLDSIAAHKLAAREADAVARRISATKDDLDGIVRDALNKINQATDEANKAKDQARSRPLTAAPEIAAIETKLRADIEAIITAAQGQVDAVDAEAAGNTTASSLAPIQEWTPRAEEAGNGSGAATPLSTGTGSPAPLSPNNGAQPADYNTVKDAGGAESPVPDKKPDTENSPLSKQAQQAAWNSDKAKGAATSPNSGVDKSPPMSSAPSSGGSPASSAGSPSSVIGQMMQPMSSAGSPASSGSPAPGASGGMSGAGNGAMPTQPGVGSGAGAAGSAGGGGASGVGRAVSAAGAGAGIAGSSARMASGAVNATANALGTAGNVGGQVAQGATTAAQATPPSPSGPATPAAPMTSGGAPMGMMPPGGGAGGPGLVSPVTSGLPAGGPNVGGAPPTTPAAVQPMSSGGLGAPAPSTAAGAAVAPLAMPGSPIRDIGAEGAMGDVLFDQAIDAGRNVITALLAQTVGYMPIDYAVSLIWERTGTVEAWMATSEGASYIPLGVRIPQDVRLAVTDPVVGRQLWDEAAAAGGADPLEVVVRHAEGREMAAPGATVLAIASSLPMAQVIDWAGAVGARPVSVDRKKVAAARDFSGALLHRCAVAMPWEWRQANAFSKQERLRVAARHMHMAANAGHLSGRACEKVMRLFEERKPIDDALWKDVAQERFLALIEYGQAVQMRGGGGAEPARALARARAAEVIECLRHYDTAEGCADLLYATRLAGAPLNPDAAVAYVA